MAYDDPSRAHAPGVVARGRMAVVSLFFLQAFLCSLAAGCLGGAAAHRSPDPGGRAGPAGRGAASSVPEGVEARLTERNAITVSWRDEFRDARGYVVERSDGRAFTEIARVEKNTARFRDTDLSPSITYSYRVCAYSSSGRSGYSKAVSATSSPASGPVIIGHDCTGILDVPVCWIKKARGTLHVACGFTEQGSQIACGMKGLESFRGSLYAVGQGSRDGGALDLRDDAFPKGTDLSLPDAASWVQATRRYLHRKPETNVVMWSWGSVARVTVQDAERYLALMEGLEGEYPGVMFVYMTAPLDGKGLEGSTHRANGLIRDFCSSKGKILYDFEDIESYDPDGEYFGDRYPRNNCDYDRDMDGWPDANWAAAWQKSHMEGRDWYSCRSPLTMPLNANLKAYAAWWLLARLSGWDGR